MGQECAVLMGRTVDGAGGEPSVGQSRQLHALETNIGLPFLISVAFSADVL